MEANEQKNNDNTPHVDTLMRDTSADIHMPWNRPDWSTIAKALARRVTSLSDIDAVYDGIGRGDVKWSIAFFNYKFGSTSLLDNADPNTLTERDIVETIFPFIQNIVLYGPNMRGDNNRKIAALHIAIAVLGLNKTDRLEHANFLDLTPFFIGARHTVMTCLCFYFLAIASAPPRGELTLTRVPALTPLEIKKYLGLSTLTTEFHHVGAVPSPKQRIPKSTIFVHYAPLRRGEQQANIAAANGLMLPAAQEYMFTRPELLALFTPMFAAAYDEGAADHHPIFFISGAEQFSLIDRGVCRYADIAPRLPSGSVVRGDVLLRMNDAAELEDYIDKFDDNVATIAAVSHFLELKNDQAIEFESRNTELSLITQLLGASLSPAIVVHTAEMKLTEHFIDFVSMCKKYHIGPAHVYLLYKAVVEEMRRGILNSHPDVDLHVLFKKIVQLAVAKKMIVVKK